MARTTYKKHYGGSLTRGLYNAGALGMAAYRGFKGRGSVKKSVSHKKKYHGSSKMQAGNNAMYGSSFTAKTSYKYRAPSRFRKRVSKKKTNAWIWQAMKLQNAQNNQGSNTFTTAAAANSQNWFSYDLLNGWTMRGLVNTQLPGGSNAAAARDFNLWIKTFRSRTVMTNTNTSGVGALIDLYYVVPRRDIPVAELGTAVPLTGPNGNVLAQYMLTQAVTAPGTSDLLGDQAGDPTANATQIGFTAFMYQNFTRLFKVLKVKTIKLPAGDQYIDTNEVKFKHLNCAKIVPPIAHDPLNRGDFDNWYVRGTSMIVLGRIRGMPTSTQASGGTSIAFTWEEQCTSKVLQTRASSSAQTLAG